MKKQSLIYWLPPILLLATALDVKAATSNGLVNMTICPLESTPTAEFIWVCHVKDITRIKALSNGKVIECFWTPRTCKDKS